MEKKEMSTDDILENLRMLIISKINLELKFH